MTRRLRLVALLLSLAAGAHAQSAADIATARQLATQGIKLYNEGKYAEALDNLQRAESLYDAPVHLLYIARAQVKLGKLVEGSEVYRRLVRTPLSPTAPQAFRDAVEDARRELPDVEANIPSLRIQVTPPGIANLEVQVDGEAIPAAGVGVERPTNPGDHRVRASAPGYTPAEDSVSLKPGEKKTLGLTLNPAPGGTPPPASGTPPKAATPDTPVGGVVETRPSGGLGFVIGLRFGGSLPSGTFTADVPMSDAFESGAAAGLYGGVRFARYFTGLLVLEGGAYKPGSTFDLRGGATQQNDVQIDNTATGSDVGFAARIGTPRGSFGGFGQIEFFPWHRLQVSSDRVRETAGVQTQCSADITYGGTAFRLGGGLVVPVLSWLQLVPAAHLTVGRLSSVDVSGDCSPQVEPPGGRPGSSELADPTTHTLFFLGVGGEWLFGADKPLK